MALGWHTVPHSALINGPDTVDRLLKLALVPPFGPFGPTYCLLCRHLPFVCLWKGCHTRLAAVHRWGGWIATQGQQNMVEWECQEAYVATIYVARYALTAYIHAIYATIYEVRVVVCSVWVAKPSMDRYRHPRCILRSLWCPLHINT